MSQSMSPNYSEPESFDDALHAFQAEIELLTQDADQILASSWDDVKPITSTSTGIEDPTKNHPLDDDWSSGDEESVPGADDTLANALQLLDILMNKDPAALSEQISKMLDDGKEDEPLLKVYFVQSRTTQEEKLPPGPTSNGERDDMGDHQVGDQNGDADGESAVSQGMSQELLRFAKESHDFVIDRVLFVRDDMRVVDAGINNNVAELIQFSGRIGTESRSVRTRKRLAKAQVLTRQQFREWAQCGRVLE